MKAIVQRRYGSPEVLALREVPAPQPANGDVLVRVRAATVNARDWHLMRGDPYLARLGMGIRTPKVKVPGTDFAGVVESAGAGVTRFRPGAEVFGEIYGAFAEYVCAPVGVVEIKPANLSFAQAAAVPTAGNTALVGLRDLAQVRPGQRVLVNGASGGVGTFAVQLAKALGAEVTGVCSTRNVSLVGTLGADHIIDYTRDDFARTGQRYDVVFDLVANRSLADLRRALTPSGTLLLAGGGVSNGGALLRPVGLVIRGSLAARFARGQRLRVVSAKPSSQNLAALRELIEAGRITPVIDRTYPLHETPDAIRYLEVEHARAKVVITV